MTPAERILRARLGGLTTAARHDTREITAPARAAFMSRFEVEVDPAGTLAPAERARRAEAARKAYFTRMALKSAQSRAKRSPARLSQPGWARATEVAETIGIGSLDTPHT